MHVFTVKHFNDQLFNVYISFVFVLSEMDFKEVWQDTVSSVSKAIKNGDLKLVRQLIRQGKSVDVSDNRGWRPIHDAAVLKHANCHLILEEILKHGNSI